MLLAVALGVLVALGNAVSGLDAVGSVAFGALWAGTGLVAAGIGALTAQALGECTHLRGLRGGGGRCALRAPCGR
ncbi:hypothetical protein G5V59_04570 [Nocardioides sp. W3-2-3]|uniref:hypothetical protein n=1 Tax=Nocardioides convexus TaxID=2712224 RepID=UPI0024185AD6|nr:hypothetical protein [Nocardioides convexus]NGZ99832.1 hypothetical protein [Nocardioides convexus]